MDEEDFSSSSNPNPNPNFDPSQFSSPKWALKVLVECAMAIETQDSTRTQHLLWVLNELSSPYGDTDQKLAAAFLQALFCKVTDSGRKTHRNLVAAAEKMYTFESTRRMMLRFQEVSPWTTFGHVAANGALIEAMNGENRIHIVDISGTYCTQWPTLLEALATRSDDTPHVRITHVLSSVGPAGHRVSREIGARMEKFARLMGVPFNFSSLHVAEIEALNHENLKLQEGEVLAINCIFSLHKVGPTSRDTAVSALRRLDPRVLTLVEEEVDLDSDRGQGFAAWLGECVRFFRAYLESLDESFPKASEERLMLERAMARAAVDLVACPADESRERRERSGWWARRMRACGFGPVGFSDDVLDDMRALLRRYREGWSMGLGRADDEAGSGVYLEWKEEPMVWASAWKP
ncbi:hypothetical protein AMTR_s00086p00066190 [Amborella trichopoda]|uniref:Uncharacterized protein n=2 Tax=Amborella trichopoda TaxID=13333 RepID=W1P4D6_AMBTC|nr:hypothetical protein AMTR_s00086p00066190 [Amborella trichopoda]